MKYKPLFTLKFEKELRKLTKKNKILYDRIKKAIDEILLDPYSISEKLKGEFKDRRKHTFGDYRIAFRVCQECRKLSLEEIADCGEVCKSTIDQTIIFLSVGHRSVFYKRLKKS